ncbi:MAG: CopK family periplasmic copper-binding protein [Proteobacteria bacterium]|nr:CopK family periplasmic copper-binding protein [Pseudomonadota bacterium]
MKKIILAIALGFLTTTAVHAAEEAAEKIELKDGATLFLHPDGTSRMVDAHGKAMQMSDGKEMETADGKTIVMMNKKVWVRWGAPGKGGEMLKND